MILMLIIRYISALLVWILTSLVVLGSLGELTSCLYNPLSSLPVCVSAGTSVLWWLYIDHRLYGNATSSRLREELREEGEELRAEGAELRDSGQALLVYAAAATVFTVRNFITTRFNI